MSKPKKGINLNTKTFQNAFTKVNQSGYESLKTFETRIVSQDPKFMDVKKDDSDPSQKIIKSETLNKFKGTYRSGFQAIAPDKITTDNKMILMGYTMPESVKNTGLYGSTNGADGYNGSMKNKLYATKYIGMDGP